MRMRKETLKKLVKEYFPRFKYKPGDLTNAMELFDKALPKAKRRKCSFEFLYGEEWHVGVDFEYSSNSGGIYGDHSKDLAEAIVLTVLRSRGWDF